jgi:hypothetical protein
MSRACTDWAVGSISASGERRRTADAVDALRAGQRDGCDACGEELLGRLRGDRGEMRDVDDGGDCSHRERTRRIEMAAAVMGTGVVGVATSHGSVVVQTLDDRGLIRAEGELQAIGLAGRQHETDGQKGARYQQR